MTSYIILILVGYYFLDIIVSMYSFVVKEHNSRLTGSRVRPFHWIASAVPSFCTGAVLALSGTRLCWQGGPLIDGLPCRQEESMYQLIHVRVDYACNRHPSSCSKRRGRGVGRGVERVERVVDLGEESIINYWPTRTCNLHPYALEGAWWWWLWFCRVCLCSCVWVRVVSCSRTLRVSQFIDHPWLLSSRFCWPAGLILNG